MRKRSYAPFSEPKTALRACAMEGCAACGEYPAPRSRQQLRDYQWFCLEHVREYNRSWNYFEGMPPEESVIFGSEAEYGHRPTWAMGVRAATQAEKILDAVFGMFGTPGVKQSSSKATLDPLPLPVREALEFFELTLPVSLEHIKKQYKILVKRYHPDANGSSREAEEQFKRLSQAYRVLCESDHFV